MPSYAQRIDSPPIYGRDVLLDGLHEALQWDPQVVDAHPISLAVMGSDTRPSLAEMNQGLSLCLANER